MELNNFYHLAAACALYTTPQVAAWGDGCSTKAGLQLCTYSDEQVTPGTGTCYMRVHSDVMLGAGIRSGDMVIIDRSLEAVNGKVVIAMLNGEMLIRRLEKIRNKTRLLPGSTALSAIDVDASGSDFTIWGVVTYVIHSL